MEEAADEGGRSTRRPMKLDVDDVSISFPQTQEARRSDRSADCDDESADVELNLGLSLGGVFGVDKRPTKLVRSNSLAGPSELSLASLASRCLIRTTSLPAETEEEWRKRKELQTFRRMEAKRRRSQKRESCYSGREQSHAEGKPSSMSVPQASSASPVPTRSSGVLESDSNSITFLRRPLSHESGEGSSGQVAGPSSLHSSLCGASSSSSGEGKSRTGTSMVSVRGSGRIERETLLKRDECLMSSMEDMPCVFTRGDGPNGRRVDGILYRYGKGDEVRIMCVCHGSFLSPAEFVNHAGGGDVQHPLRHIVVAPPSSSSSSL